MPRKRMIDPSIWSDEGLASLTHREQLLFIGLFSNADDEGRLNGTPRAIRLMLPTIYGDLSEAEVRSDLDAVLGAMRHLSRYQVDGRDYLEFTNYTRWQKIDHPSASRLPAQFAERSANDTGAFAQNPPNRKEVNRKEEKLVEERVTRAVRAPRHREPISVEQIEALVVEFGPLLGGESEARETIAAALNHNAVEKAKTEYLYVRTWLRNDAKRHPLRVERANGTHRTRPESVDDPDLAALAKYR